VILNAEQRVAVEYPGHCAIVACPGAGKTRVLVEKTAHLVTTQPEARVLVVTFSRDAAAEVRARLQQRVPDALQRVEAQTFHALAMRHCLSSGLVDQFIGPAQQAALLRRAWSHVGSSIPWETFSRTVEARVSGMAPASPHPTFDAAFSYYVELLDAHAASDFAHLVVRSAQAIRAGTAARLPFSHLLIDEAQDVDGPQLEWTLSHAEGGAVTVLVGDDDQAIYGFRGALGHAAVDQAVRQLGARLLRLQVNYRSNSEILGLASRLIRHNTHRVPKELQAHRGPGGTVTLLPCHDSEREVEEIVERVRRQPGDWAILARSNFKLDDVERGLVSAGVPYVRPESQDFWESQGPALLLSLLASRGSLDPLALGAALSHAGVPEADIREVVRLGGRITLGRALDPVTPKRLASLLRCLSGLESADPEAAIRAASKWLLETAVDARGVSPAIKAATDVLLALAGTLSDRLRFVRLRRQRETDGAVTLTTFHKAKGREWPRVIVCGLNDGVVPSRKAESIEEERRLLYVAMTRAESELVLTFPWQLVQEGAKVRRRVNAVPSRFLTADLAIPLCRPPETDASVHD
jgi:superfamily I DNA/RNA helicase